MTIPAAPMRASCSQPIISCSALVWWNRSDRPNASASSRQSLLDIGKRRAPVNVRLALAEQLQIGSVQDENDSAPSQFILPPGFSRLRGPCWLLLRP